MGKIIESTKYLDFIEFENTGRKTRVYGVYNKNSGNIIGCIKWYNKWRQYCFYPMNDTIFSNDCMNDIIKTINFIKINI